VERKGGKKKTQNPKMNRKKPTVFWGGRGKAARKKKVWKSQPNSIGGEVPRKSNTKKKKLTRGGTELLQKREKKKK